MKLGTLETSLLTMFFVLLKCCVEALVFDYERVNQLDLLAANGTFLSQPMVRKAMVVIEVQIREYPRFRLFPRFRNGRFRLLATSLPLLLRTLLNR